MSHPARVGKALSVIDRLSTVWKSDLSDKIEWEFFQAVAMSVLLYGYTTWTLTKHSEKNLDGNVTKMLCAVLNKSWKENLTKHHRYGHQSPISQTIQVRQIRHAGYSWRNKNELISGILQWTSIHGLTSVVWQARTYIHQLCANTGWWESGEREKESKESVQSVRLDDDDDDDSIYV